jgi:ACT domain-containing protein
MIYLGCLDQIIFNYDYLHNTCIYFLKRMASLCAVHRAIKNKIKGPTTEIAAQVGISRSSFYKYVDEISDYGYKLIALES